MSCVYEIGEKARRTRRLQHSAFYSTQKRMQNVYDILHFTAHKNNKKTNLKKSNHQMRPRLNILQHTKT